MSLRMMAHDVTTAVSGRLVQGPPNVILNNVVIDSRSVAPGDLFVALPGEHTDGHRFVPAAARSGAAGVLVSREVSAELPGQCAVIRVDDTAVGLGLLARHYRRSLGQVVVIAITGSVGKTTTKDLLASILERRGPTLKTHANWNTEIGVPLMVFQLEPGHKFGVFELAMRALSEIRWLTRIVQPQFGVLTNIQETHMELLGSQENIARAKAELLEELGPGGTAILNGDDEWVRRMSPRMKGRVAWYGVDRTGAEYRAVNVTSLGRSISFSLVDSAGNEHPVELPMPGTHNVYNALAAVATCRELGIGWDDIVAGLSSPTLTGMRMEVLELGAITVLNDAYNANPHSTVAALEALKNLAGTRRRVVVLGDMLELGPREQSGHAQVGRVLAQHGPARVLLVGPRMRWAREAAVDQGLDAQRVHSCDDYQEACDLVEGLVRDGDVVLVKGSRGMALEHVVERLRAQYVA